MSIGATLFVIAEIIAAALLAIGYVYEDRFIQFEDEIIARIKERRVKSR